MVIFAQYLRYGDALSVRLQFNNTAVHGCLYKRMNSAASKNLNRRYRDERLIDVVGEGFLRDVTKVSISNPVQVLEAERVDFLPRPQSINNSAHTANSEIRLQTSRSSLVTACPTSGPQTSDGKSRLSM